MTTLSPDLQQALTAFREGDLDRARASVEKALIRSQDEPAAFAFLGMLLCRQGQVAEAVTPLGRALAAWPQDLATRVNLASALLQVGDTQEALALCEAGPAGDPKLQRIVAYIHQKEGRLQEAKIAYSVVLAKFPGDFESWSNLGNVHAGLGNMEDAIDAFERAVALRPDLAILYLNFAEQLGRAGRDQQRRNVMQAAVAAIVGDADLHTELGLAESAMKDYPAAEQAYRTALRLRPGLKSAYVELGLLLEALNKIDDLAALVAELRQQGLADPEIDFVEAWLLRRRGQWTAALDLAERVPPSIEPMRRAELIAGILDRTGQADRAFRAYQDMNNSSRSSMRDTGASDFHDEIVRKTDLLTEQWVASWSKPELELSPPSPIFIVGFPRSGTTLLDTMLMNIPHLHILEELPLMSAVETMLEDPRRLADMDTHRANMLRRRYFEELQALSPPADAQGVIVDKFPLHMARMPLIHRLFPDAKILFAQRHPCDVVLSCFMSNFTLNRAMRHFTSLEDTARLYDAVLMAWTRATDLLPIHRHTVCYERMVEDRETEMREAIGFLGMDWDPGVLDHQGAAARRYYISTASYSQVTEPIYQRASGRWQRYRAQMEPVLPILAPWAEKMGYEL